MPLTEKDNQLIDDFLSNRLSTQAQQVFAERLQDADFEGEVNFRKDLLVAAKQVGRKDAKNSLRNFEAAISNENNTISAPAKIVSMRRWWMMAAAGVALLAIGVWGLFPTEEPIDYFAQYYETYPNVVTPPIVKGENDTTQIAISFQAYELKNYEDAKVLFEQLPNNLTNDFYRGMIEIELENYEKAHELLKNNTIQLDSQFCIPANFYSGLIDLKTMDLSNPDTAYPITEHFEIVAKSTKYPYLKKKAEEILRSFKEE